MSRSVSGRARISWLLNDTTPSGRSVMAVRRMQSLAGQHRVGAFYLNTSPTPPGHSGLALLRPARSLGGEARLARSDIVVTTSESTVGSAVARRTAGTRIVHFLHDRPDFALSTIRFMRSVPSIAHVVVPVSVDPADFAARAGLAADRVSVMDDFVPTAATLLGTARARTALLVGRVTPDVHDIVAGFRLALPRLPGWQLRIAGHGPASAELSAAVEDAGLQSRVLLLGNRYDCARQIADAGVVVRLAPHDVNGLSVLEALAAGVPVLGGSRVPAVRRFVQHERNGVVLDRIDPEAIAEGFAMMADDERRASLAANARGERSSIPSAPGQSLPGLLTRVLAEPASPGGTS